jgi:hypothetical protein
MLPEVEAALEYWRETNQNPVRWGRFEAVYENILRIRVHVGSRDMITGEKYYPLVTRDYWRETAGVRYADRAYSGEYFAR